MSEALSESEWLAQQFDALPVEALRVTPSSWAETKRYLPPSVTSLPGYYRFDVAPYLKEIVDCMSIDSPVREIALMKGVQVCATVGILENTIGYLIDFVKTAPVMFVTADQDLAKLRMDTCIVPMIQFSGLEPLIKSGDEGNNRKTGKTDKKLEWIGGGFLIPFGAKNANKLRSISIRYLLRDEIDGWDDNVGKDGDPIKLSADRTAAYEGSRKVLDLSTPLLKGTSKIEKRFRLGDQRYYFVNCLKCGFAQTLRWRRTGDGGEVSGIVWDTENSRLVPGSVRYLCENCHHPHTNDDKTRLLSPAHGAAWRPTATASSPHIRSYHISALYSPVGMQTWEACVQKWLEAWDDERGRPRDMLALQVFYNNVLGETFEVRGDKVPFERVSAHRRHCYRFGEIPNKFAIQHCGSAVLVLVCTVDVHKESLAVSVWGWCRDRRPVLVFYERFGVDAERPGNTENLDDPHTWVRLRELIEGKEYIADDGKKYRIAITLVDSGYRADDVYRFCAEYQSGVYPVKGMSTPNAGRHKEFASFVTPMGTTGYGIFVDVYKDRWGASLRRSDWDGLSLQPEGHFNAPIDITDKQLRELTVETKVVRIDKETGQRIGYVWQRPSGSANELWDCLVYANAALDMLAMDYCVNQLDLEFVNWIAFYDRLAQGAFFTEG